MTWYVIYDKATGRQVSETDDLAQIGDKGILPAHLAVKEVAMRPDDEVAAWDSAALDIVMVQPNPVPVNPLLASDAATWTDVERSQCLQEILKKLTA